MTSIKKILLYTQIFEKMFKSTNAWVIQQLSCRKWERENILKIVGQSSEAIVDNRTKANVMKTRTYRSMNNYREMKISKKLKYNDQ